jgi:hypothetical protein
MTGARRVVAQAGFVIWFVTPLALDMLSILRCHAKLNWAHFCDPGIDAEVACVAVLDQLWVR